MEESFLAKLWGGVTDSGVRGVVKLLCQPSSSNDFADGGGPGSNGEGVLFDIGVSQNFEFFQTRKFSKNVKKAMKKL